jgi:hypothetical protein
VSNVQLPIYETIYYSRKMVRWTPNDEPKGYTINRLFRILVFFIRLANLFRQHLSTNQIFWDTLRPSHSKFRLSVQDREHNNNRHSDPSFPLRSCIPKTESQDSKKSDSHLSNRHLRTSNKTSSRKRRALQEKVGKAIDLSPPEPDSSKQTKKEPNPDSKKRNRVPP